MNLIDGLKRTLTFGGTGTFTEPPFWTQEWLRGTTSTWGSDKEEIENSFEDYVAKAYKSNGIVFACVLARLLPFSEARFQFQRLVNGRPGDLFGNESLSLLERPWPNGTTGELLGRIEQNGSLAGNFYATTVGTGPARRVRVLRPDWITIVSGVKGDDEGSPFDLDAEVLGYIYRPGGRLDRPVFLTPDRVVHYSPIPDPEAQWRGMSWLTPILSEISSDTAATKHKLRFFENGAQSNLVVTYDKSISKELFQASVKLFNEEHKGEANAYKTIHLGGGNDAKVLTTDLKSIDFKAVQGAGETRIAAAAGVGAIIARISEGMQGSSLNAGNYAAAKRQFADMTLRPLWRSAAASLAKLVAVPSGSRLWFDDRDIAFLKEDLKDAAEITSLQASTIRTLTDAGYTPESVVAAIQNSDFGRLVHSGLYSVQLNAVGGDVELSLATKIEAVGALVRAGYDPTAALAAVGLNPIRHLGLLPVTLQSRQQLELTP